MRSFSVFKEAIAVGLLTLIVGSLISTLFKQKVPGPCRNWNKSHVMEISLFLTGFALHFLCELFGINKWYCQHGSACS